MLAIRMAVQYVFEQGIQLGLREDLLDIRNSYMQPESRSCFWVAEMKGSIVGTVGILPCVEEPVVEGFRTQFCLFCSPAEGSADISAVALLSHTHLPTQISQTDLHTSHSTQSNAGILLTIHMLVGSSELRHPVGPPLVSLSVSPLGFSLCLCWSWTKTHISDTHHMDKGLSDES
ncbi:hypothetical protein G5714_013322 [Onychostoma macrolepis]|uniref:Uncharacterized protein n=1 Tax=Onychostoma macrolepis TaxID=369639 RepID=A0A7J6CEK2_9TELE|nr:hypothetical protein G5714_013322 [Onychostoma macrolepis]